MARMLTVPSMLEDTAIAAAGGGTVLHLHADSARPGRADAIVLTGGRIVHVALDRALGSAVVGPPQPVRPTAPPSRRCALALR
jgi:hypothetical protein